MADHQRIEDLRRRVQKDPASIAFAQLAEECRRAGRYEEAVEVCRAGLAVHPGYLSARVTLGRALIELDQPDEALQLVNDHEYGNGTAIFTSSGAPLLGWIRPRPGRSSSALRVWHFSGFFSS